MAVIGLLASSNNEPVACIMWPRYMIPPQAHADGLHIYGRGVQAILGRQLPARSKMEVLEPYAPFPSVMALNRQQALD